MTLGVIYLGCKQNWYICYQPANRLIIDYKNYNFIQQSFQSPVVFSLINVIKHALTSGAIFILGLILVEKLKTYGL